MASLEYLTQNSLIAYPFKPRRPTAQAATHPIADDWFCDILFVSFDHAIRACYVSRLEKTNDGRLLITLSNPSTETIYTWTDEDTEDPTSTIIIASDDLVNHLDSKPRSFAAHKNNLFAVKFVFGPGLISYPAFSQNYESGEAELANGTIVMASAKVTELSLENYVKNQDNSNPYQTAKTYTSVDIPEIQGRYNVTVPLETDGTAGINVAAGSGFGLFNSCVAAGSIDEIYSINSTQPSPDGKFFISVDQCYSLNPLTASEKIILGERLDKYEPFRLYHSLGDYTDFNFATTVNNTLVLTNFCKPKCPPENIKAFAHYLNRVIDGAGDLSKLITEKKETRGLGTVNLTTFTASEFCTDENSPFLRCSEHTSPVDSYIGCNDKFIKYYHEFRKLQIFYNNGEVYTFTILEVIDDNTLLLDSLPPAYTQPKYFRVVDNGVVSDLNCAFQAYNLDAAEFKQPYFKVIHTTAESADAKGAVVTLVGVAVAIFNPSSNSVNFTVDFAVNSKLTQEGKFKIRKDSGTYFSSTPTATTQCMEYAFIEATFAMACGEDGGNVDISVYKTQNNTTTQVGNPFNIPNISAASCFESTVTEQKIRITSVGFELFSYPTQLPAGTTGLSDLYYAPSWLILSFLPSANPQSVLSTGYSATPPETNQLFDGVYSAKTADSSYLYKLVIDYVALPVITSPITGDFTEDDPLLFVPGNTYTASSPLLVISATNMRSFSTNFPADVYAYSLVNSTLPEGLILNSNTGLITGAVPTGFSQNLPVHITVSASNPAGTALASSTIFLQKYAGVAVPELSFSPLIEDAVFPVNNATTYASLGINKIFTVTATNPPILGYRLAGDDLPLGLYFNQATGAITGKLVDSSAQTTAHTIYASNGSGESVGLDFVLNYTIYAAPVIVYPTTTTSLELNENSETTAENPLIVISASQLFGGVDNYADGLTDQTRNKYTATNIPPGFSIESYTGKIYGKISIPVNETKYYSTLVTVNNPVGSAYVYIYFVFAMPGVPVVKTIGVVSIVKNNPYTEQSPLFTIEATNQPISFAATGLPEGLSCTSSGKIVGTVSNQLEAGMYSVACVAANQHGTSISVTVPVKALVSIVYPGSTDSYTLAKNQNYSNVFTVIHSGVKSGDDVTVTLAGIPTGLSFTNNKLSGTPTVDYAGNMRLLATTTNYGYDYLDIPIEVLGVTYAVTGVVVDALTNLPLSGVLISASTTKTTTTNQLGEYTLLLSSGGYSITPSKSDYIFSPPSIYTQVSGAPISGQSFKGLAQYRGVSGYVKTEDMTPVSGVTISDGVSNAITSSTGFYQLLSPVTEITITPTIEGRVFSPENIVIPPGEVDTENINFTAVVTKVVSGWVEDKSGNQYFQGAVVISALNTATSQTYTRTITEGTASPALYIFSLHAGNYIISASSTSYILAPTEIVKTINADSPSNNFTARISGIIDGQVVLASSSSGPQIPVRNATISTLLAGGVTRSTSTDNSGLFSFQVPLGTSYLTVRINSIDVAPAVQATSPSSGIQINPYTTTISGSVILDSSAYIGAELSLTFPGSTTVLRQATSSANGYILFNIPSGNYEIKPYKKGYSFTPSVISVTVSGTTPVFSKNFTVEANGNPPLAPTITAYTATNTAIVIEFTPPTDTDDIGAIVGYKYSIDGGSNYINASAGQFVTPTKIQISALTQGVDYLIKLKAYNASGDGLESNQITARTIEPATAPQNLQASTSGSSVILTFNPPINNGGAAITDYEYRYAQAENVLSNENWISAGTATSPIQISGLTGGFTLFFQVRAINSSVAGTPSEIANVFLNSVPEAPTIIEVTQLNQGLRIKFGTVNDGGEPVTAYQYSLDNGETIITLQTADLIQDLQISYPVYLYDFLNLTNGQPYTLKLRAINMLGNGAWRTVENLIPATTPKSPDILSVIETNQRLIIAFKLLGNTPTEDPDNGGSAILDYTFEAYTDAEFTQLVKSANTLTSPFNFIELENGTGLYIRVKARSLVNGESVYGIFESTESYIPNISAPLSPPTVAAAVTAPDEQYRVFFSIPENFDNGGAAADLITVNVYGINPSPGEPDILLATAADLTYSATANPAYFVTSFNRLLQYDWSPTSVDISFQNSVGHGPWSNTVNLLPLEEQVPEAPTVELISYTNGEDSSAVAFTVTPNALRAYPLVNITVKILGQGTILAQQTYTDFDGFSATLVTSALPNIGDGLSITATVSNFIGDSPEGSAWFTYYAPPPTPTEQYLSVYAYYDTYSEQQSIFLNFSYAEYVGVYSITPLTQITAKVYNKLTDEIENTVPVSLNNQTGFLLSDYAPVVVQTYKKVVITLTNIRGSTDVVFNDVLLYGKPLPPVIEYTKPGIGNISFSLAAAVDDPTSPNQIARPQQDVEDLGPGYITDAQDNIIYRNVASGTFSFTPGQIVKIYAWWYNLNYRSDTATITAQTLNYALFPGNTTLSISVRRSAFKINVSNLANCGGCDCTYSIYAYLSTNSNIADLSATTPTSEPLGPYDPVPDYSLINITGLEYAYIMLPYGPTDIKQLKFILDVANCASSPSAQTAYVDNRRLISINNFTSSSSTNLIPFAPVISYLSQINGGMRMSVDTGETHSRGIPIFKFQYSKNGAIAWTDVTADDVTHDGSGTYYIYVRNFTNWISQTVRVRIMNNQLATGDPSSILEFVPSGPPGVAVISAQSTVHSDKLAVNFTIAGRGLYPILKYRYTTNALDATPIWIDAVSPNAQVVGSKDTATTINILKQSNQNALILGSQYSVKITASNYLGESPASNSVNYVASLVPFKITLVTHTPSSRVLSVNITFAGNGGAPINKYRWTLNGDAESPTWVMVTTTSQTSVTLTINNWNGNPLNNGTTYFFRVYAENIAGAGQISDTFNMTPSTVPNAPVINSLVSLNNKIRVMYTPPAFDGGNSIKNYSYSTDDGVIFTPTSPANGNPSYIDVPNLINDEYYIVKIRAINDRGAGAISNYKIGAPKAQ